MSGKTGTPAKEAIPATLQPLKVPIASLKPYPHNPRQGDVGAIVESLRWHGQYRPIVVNKRTTEVLAGNHTLRAALELGWSDIAATFVDVDEDTAARIVLVDNRSNDVAAYDDHALIDLLRSLPTLDGTGFDEDALGELLQDVGAVGDRAGEDTDPIEPPAEPRTKTGDLYVLGEHRLLCGDSTDAAAVDRLLDGAKPSVLVTDPPYGVDYSEVVASRENQKKGGWKPIAGDALADDALGALVRNALSLVPAPVLFVWHPSNRVEVFLAAIRDAGWKPTQQIVWVKSALVFGRSDYQWRHEPCIYAKRDGASRQEDRTATTVWEFPKPSGEDHPTSKPIGVYEIPYTNHSARGDAVYEPFAGSGSACIAAENLGRRALMMELDPAYCDVIVDRWERHTERKAIVKTP